MCECRLQKFVLIEAEKSIKYLWLLPSVLSLQEVVKIELCPFINLFEANEKKKQNRSHLKFIFRQYLLINFVGPEWQVKNWLANIFKLRNGIGI